MWLTVRAGANQGKTYRAHGERFVIGREAEGDVDLDDARVSRQHAFLTDLGDGRVTLTDLGSLNGTYVDGKRIEAPIVLRGGEEIRVGNTVLAVSATAPGATVAAPIPTLAPAPASPRLPPPPPGSPPRPTGASGPPGDATAERRMLRRSLRRTTVVAVVSLVVAVATVALFATGVLPPDSGDDRASTPTIPLTTADVVDVVARSTVLVVALFDGERVGSGTGWVLDAEEGLIVTNAHVVNGGAEFEIGMGDDQQPAELLGVAPCDDLAVLAVDGMTDLTTMSLGTQTDLRLGEEVVAVGFPETADPIDELTATTGVVSVVRTSYEGGGELPPYRDLVRTDAAINPGNSGGPLVTRKDQLLVGVNTFGITGDAQNANFAIGVDRVKEVTDELREGRSQGWTGMGFYFPEDEDELVDFDLPARPGIVALGSVAGSPAEEAGFGEEAVLLVAVDGHRLDDGLPSYCQAVGDLGEGDSAVFSVLTPGSTRPTDVEVDFG
ncbi:MAG: serine protease Do [Actinomycetota bacterium]|jgi:S1-C subfamily serine protease|nr:serine protease Do [Actinomycetota bacterium]